MALADAEDQVREHLGEVKELREQVALALDRAEQNLEQARRALAAASAALAAAYAMSTKSRAMAATLPAPRRPRPPSPEAEARIQAAKRRIGICAAAADILDPLAERLARALGQLRTVPQNLGEVYELVYEFVRSGGSCRGTDAGS